MELTELLKLGGAHPASKCMADPDALMRSWDKEGYSRARNEDTGSG
jgi:hypothetical protein